MQYIYGLLGYTFSRRVVEPVQYMIRSKTGLVAHGLTFHLYFGAIHRMRINEEMLEGLNKVLDPITRSAVVEDLHLHRSSSSLKGQFQGLRDRAYLLDSMRFLQGWRKL